MPAAESGGSSVRLRADVERWLDELGLVPIARADRDGVTSWDLRLDGLRRFDLPITLILDPALALICWVHFAPPIGDAFRKSYPEAAPLERRVPVREVLARRGRAAGPRDGAADRGARSGRAGRRDRALAARSPTGCSRSRRAGSGSAAGSRITSGRTSRGAALLDALREPARRARRRADAVARDRRRRRAAPPEPVRDMSRRRDSGLARRPRAPPSSSTPLAALAAGGRCPARRPRPRPRRGLTTTADARYVVDPATHRVHVSVALSATNHLNDTKTHRYFFDRSFMAVPPGTANFKISSPGAHAARRRRPPGTRPYNLLRIDFGKPLAAGGDAGVHPVVRHPGSGRRADAGDADRDEPRDVQRLGPRQRRRHGRERHRRVPGRVQRRRDGAGPRRADDSTPPATTIFTTGRLANPLTFIAYVRRRPAERLHGDDAQGPDRRPRRSRSRSGPGPTTRPGPSGSRAS